MTGNIAFIFPGQGSQSAGMGKDICAHHPTARFIFAEADEVLERSLSTLCFEGSDVELSLTVNTQPAIVITSLALYKCFIEKGGPQATFTAGHSVGEYAALAAAGVVAVQDVVRLVDSRANLMDSACPAGKGGMAALIGLNRSQVEEMIKNLGLPDEKILDIAGLNCPGQVVVAGDSEAIELAITRVREFGGRMGVKLNVSGPFHSRLMKSAEEGLIQKLSETEFNDAIIPVIPNTTAEGTTNQEQIKTALKSQLTLPVLWEDSVRFMIDRGINTFVEFGSGNVLAGMIRKIDRQVRVIPVHDSATLDAALEELC